MKHKTYGDNNKEFEYGSGIEIISSKDPISARSVNRPIVNLYENQEETYKLLNTLLKSVYGNVTNAILPDNYEDFCTEGFTINSFKNDASNFFLRVPTGMILLNNNKYNPERNVNNPFSIQGEYDYKEEFKKDELTMDSDRSFVYDNRPNISLLERQLSNFIALDLNDLTNDINIHETEVPMTYNIEIRDPISGFQLFDPDGNLSYVTDSSGNQVFICNDEDAEFYIEEEVNFSNLEVEYNYKPCGDNNKLGDNFNSEKNKKYFINKKPNETVKLIKREKDKNKPEGSTSVTTDYNKATKVLDYNGNIKRKIGYYADITRATDQDDEITYLPNVKENAYWNICLPYGGDPSFQNKDKEFTYHIEFLDHNNRDLVNFEFFFFDYASENDINNMLFNKILIEGKDYFKVTKYQFRVNGSELKHGVKIACKSNSNNCNDYKLKITYTSNTFEGEKICKTLDEETGWEDNLINDVLPEPAHRQKCYNNIFELTNAFLGRYSSYQIDIKSIYNYLSGETILKLPSRYNAFSLYYDIKANALDNGEEEYYDKSGKIYLSTTPYKDDEKNNLIKLFDIEIERPSGVSLAPRISKIKVYPITLDKRKISTKSSEYDTLISNYRTELNNYVIIGDEDRKIEIAELAEKNDKQTRVTSPVLRLSTDNHISEKENIWDDTYGGDGESDFYDSYESRDFVTNDKKMNYHVDSDMGIIINKNKGIKIYNNDIDKTKGRHNDISEYKPIEIVSDRGNINIVSTDNHSEDAGSEDVLSNTRINIKNLRDSKNNIIDMLGISRIRSSQDVQLVIKKREEKDSRSNGASIAFVNGPSEVNVNKNALENIKDHENDDIIVGRINFHSGIDSVEEDPNNTPNNRMFDILLSEKGEINSLSRVISGRSSKNDDLRKVITMFGDIVPDEENKNSIGFPIKSRTYYEDSETVSYKGEEQTKADIQVDKNGTSTNFISKENRWLSSFIRYGYFGKVTLADREEDISNLDSRNGALRLGNSNIYDISSIYINHGGSNTIRKNAGTINFDNFYDSKRENTIRSSAKKEEDSSVSIIINRKMNFPIEDTEVENSENCFMSQKNTLFGTTFGKDVYVNRQLFINEHKDATQDDNNILVVKGQSIFNGELILGLDLNKLKDDHKVTTKKNATFNNYIQDKETSSDGSNKLYNLEFPTEVEVDGKIETVSAKEDHSNLYTFRNYGKAYFQGDITLNKDSKFTEDTKFDKKVTIENHAKNGSSYDSKSSLKHSVFNNKYYTDNYETADYVSDDTCVTTSRHHTALEVVNGTIVFGNDPENEEQTEYDDSDLKLSGSQWVKRRLEIGTSSPKLFDNYIYEENLIDGRDSKSSPILYVEGATNLNGDVVFGGGLRDSPYGSFKGNISKSWRDDEKETNSINPIKAIFWGDHEIEPELNREITVTDFDFHGATWFDNSVKIGGGKKEEDSKDPEGRLLVKGVDRSPDEKTTLTEWRSKYSTVGIEGTISVIGEKGYNEIVGDEIYLKGKNSELRINDDEGNTLLNSSGKLNISSTGLLDITSKEGLSVTGKTIDVKSTGETVKINNNEKNKIEMFSTTKENKIDITSENKINIIANTTSNINMSKDKISINAGDSSCISLDNVSSNGFNVSVLGTTNIDGDTSIVGTFKIKNVLFEKTEKTHEDSDGNTVVDSELLEITFK